MARALAILLENDISHSLISDAISILFMVSVIGVVIFNCSRKGERPSQPASNMTYYGSGGGGGDNYKRGGDGYNNPSKAREGKGSSSAGGIGGAYNYKRGGSDYNNRSKAREGKGGSSGGISGASLGCATGSRAGLAAGASVSLAATLAIDFAIDAANSNDSNRCSSGKTSTEGGDSDGKSGSCGGASTKDDDSGGSYGGIGGASIGGDDYGGASGSGGGSGGASAGGGDSGGDGGSGGGSGCGGGRFSWKIGIFRKKIISWTSLPFDARQLFTVNFVLPPSSLDSRQIFTAPNFTLRQIFLSHRISPKSQQIAPI